jgi:hypothetical protein
VRSVEDLLANAGLCDPPPHGEVVVHEADTFTYDLRLEVEDLRERALSDDEMRLCRAALCYRARWMGSTPAGTALRARLARLMKRARDRRSTG